MRALSNTPDPDIEFPDDHDTVLRPIIQETIRTQICRHEPRYLVDRIAVATQQQEADAVKETFRLWLSDGEMCIQALLKRGAHPFVVSGDICAGSFVRLLEYELVKLPKASGEGFVWILAVANLCEEGHDGRTVLASEEDEIVISDDDRILEELARSVAGRAFAGEHEPMAQQDQAAPPVKSAVPTPVYGQSPLTTPRKRKSSEEPAALSPLDPNILGSKGKARKRFRRLPKMHSPNKKTLEEQTSELRDRLIALQSTPTKQRTRAVTEAPSPSPVTRSRPPQPVSPAVQTMPALQPSPTRSTLPKPIQRPLRITSLADVTGVRATRNTIHDVLAVITHVNPRLLARRGFPDSRELLIMDRSTSKQVHLTVFVDAANFQPEPGTVALFRNLTTHEYNGGSLKAYVQRCAGKLWFIPECPGWEWRAEADDLRRCLEERPEVGTLPDRAWWTDRGLQKRSQQESL